MQEHFWHNRKVLCIISPIYLMAYGVYLRYKPQTSQEPAPVYRTIIHNNVELKIQSTDRVLEFMVKGPLQELDANYKREMANTITRWYQDHGMQVTHDLPSQTGFESVLFDCNTSSTNNANRFIELMSIKNVFEDTYGFKIIIGDPANFETDAFDEFVKIWRHNFGITQEYFS